MGLPDTTTRSLVWKLLLNAYPKSPTKWKEVDAKNLRMYEAFVEEFVLSKNRAIGKGEDRRVPSRSTRLGSTRRTSTRPTRIP